VKKKMKLFISSVQNELAEERRAVKSFIEKVVRPMGAINE
jgi:hypothetical protein